MAELCKSLTVLGQRIKKLHSNTKKSKSRFTKSYLETRYETLAEYWAAYLKLFEELVIKLSPKELEELKDNPLEEYESLEGEYLDFKTMLKDALTQLEQSDISASEKSQVQPPVGAETTRKTRLPYIQIKRFSGDYNEWLSFRDIFVSLIHKDDTLSQVEKHHYLRSNISGEAEALLKHFTITAANYSKAWEALERRYNNKRIIVSTILNRFISQKKLSGECSKALKEILDTTQECMNSLNNLGIETSSWDPIIIHLVVSKLDLETHKLWEQSLGSSQEVPTFESLAAFLESRFKAMEIVSNNRKEVPRRETSKPTQHHFNKSTPLKTLVAEVKTVCTYCNQNHYICHCTDFKALDIPERHAFVKKNNLCFNCLVQGHSVTRCRQTINCRKCGRRHHTLLHLTSSPVPSSPEESKPPETHEAVSMKVEAQTGQVILPTAQIIVYAQNGTPHQLRALVDHGSQACLVTEEAAQILKLDRVAVNGKITGISTENEIATKSIVNLKFHSVYDDTHIMITKAYVLKRLTSLLPSQELSMDDSWPLLKSLNLADPHFGKPGHIDILLGADMHAQLIIDGLHRHNSLIALNSRLGWLISGQVTEETRSTHQVVVTHVKLELDQLLRRFWELEENTSKRSLTPLETQCEDNYRNTHTRNAEGRYIVRLPFKDGYDSRIGDSRSVAVRRLLQMERKFKNKPEFREEYCKFMQQYEALGHMNLVPENETKEKQCYYLPHHAVLRESSTTTKLRVVFDGSAKPENGNALNDELLIGPPLLQDIRDLVTRWRTHQFCLAADIQQMYRQILMSPEDADYQRIVWRETPEENIIEYRLATVTYGTSSAPFLAIRTLHQLADDELSYFPELAPKLKTDTFMDDLLTGCSSEEDCIAAQQQFTQLLLKGGFLLHKWSSNSEKVLSGIPSASKSIQSVVNIQMDDSIKALGIAWNPRSDSFELKMTMDSHTGAPTKRSVLSTIAKTFDPLGWLSPIVILLKIFMQKLWLAGLGWDDVLGDALKTEWCAYHDNIVNMDTISLPRWLEVKPTNTRIEVHGYSDASCAAYACVTYLRVLNGNTITVKLISAKSRVAPVKQVSLPRLELCGAVLLADMLRDIKVSLNIDNANVYAWSDSTIVLAWLRKNPNTWTTFVANRTSQILSVTNSNQWRHVSSSDNPADIASRGVSPNELRESKLWWEGPSFLKENVDFDSIQSVPDTLLETKYSKPKVVTNITIDEHDNNSNFYLSKYSTFTKLIRVTAYCLRFIKKCKIKAKIDVTVYFPQYLTSSELYRAENICISMSQSIFFKIEIELLSKSKPLPKSSKLYSLNPFIDKDNVLRVGGRLANALISYDRKSPILLSSKCHLTKLIVINTHLKTLHGGFQLTFNTINSKYFIIGGKNLTKKIIRQCVACFKQRASPSAPFMGNLPSFRTKPSRPFSTSGVDLAGPYNLKLYSGRCTRTCKAYISLFICTVTKAIHLELVENLSTVAFMAAFKRFTSRRGHCSDLYSDCGTNFRGASKELDAQFRNSHSALVQEISELLSNDHTSWHFIPPGAPHFGGLWESGVKSIKGHLKRTIGQTCLTFGEFNTLLTQVEACVNSRPLTLVSSTLDEPPLTPGHFLIGTSPVIIPEPNLESSRINYLDRWQIVQRMLQALWRRWQAEYLTTLQHRYKWNKHQKDIKLGTIVLVKDDRLPPGKWLLGRVIDKHPGADGITRVVTLQYKNNIFKRPVAKLCPLPLEIDT